MNVGAMLRDGRIGMIDIGRSLSDEQAAMGVPGCPEWTIRDVYAHQAGVVTDVLAGRIEGVATDPWTARQVEERADHSLTQILDEWEAGAPQFEEMFKDGGVPEAIFDQWTHEQDIRCTIDRPGNRDDARAKFVVEQMVSSLASSWERDPITVVAESGTFHFGDGDPKITLRASDYDLARVFFGRRSRAQVLEMDWDGDPEPVIDALCVFSFAENDQPV